jgi:sigma-E factor negative regulatory protein RseA
VTGMEQISALIDGELEHVQALAILKRVQGDSDARDAWGIYHLIGDALRRDGVAMPRFGGGFAASLDAEPTVLAPRPTRVERRARVYAMSAVASVAGVAAVTWLVMFGPQRAGPDAVTAEVVDPGVNSELVLAHHEYAESAATPGVGAFIRTVSTQDARPSR